MPTLKLQGRPYSYRTAGTGEPVVLLHGFPFTSEGFWPQLDAPPQGVRLICPDHRGFGASAASSTAVSIDSMAEDALALIDALGLEAAVVGGVSMGGYAAMAAARLQPKRIRALVLANTHPWPDDEAGKQRREAVAADLEKNGMAQYASAALGNLLAASAKPYVRSRLLAIMTSVNPTPAAAAARAMAQRADSRPTLQQFSGPALVIAGELDALVPPSRAAEMAQLLKHPTRCTVPNVGHLVNLEAPGVFNEAVGTFVAGLSARGAS